MVNKVILVGNVGQDVTTRDVSSGIVANTSLATTEKRNGEEKTEWHRIVAWGRTAELCAQYLAKGRTVYVEEQTVTPVRGAGRPHSMLTTISSFA